VKKDGWFHQRPWGSWGPYILLVNDGGLCSYVQKVRNAQHVGASGVLIAPLPSDNSTNSNYNDPSNDTTFQLPHGAMMDDGSGGDITIPSFYMTNEDSDAIKKELIADIVVLAQMSWFSTISSTKMQYDLWTASPLDETFIKFVKNFKDTAMALKDYTQFEPHSYIHDGSQYSCIGNTNCESLCTNHGRYVEVRKRSRLKGPYLIEHLTLATRFSPYYFSLDIAPVIPMATYRKGFQEKILF